MRKRLVAANWKMNHLAADGARYVQALSAAADSWSVEAVVFPPSTLLMLLNRMLSGTGVQLGAQNCFPAARGAFTGEVSPPQVMDAGARWLLVGHSERRHVMGESDEMVAKKLRAGVEAGLRVLLCVGEQEEERDDGMTEEVLERQCLALAGLAPDEAQHVSLAYEPVWAIGTGNVATPLQAQEAHAFLRQRVSELLGAEIARGMRIVYGGSITPQSFPSILEQPDVDGGLVGGASLDADRFVELVRQANG